MLSANKIMVVPKHYYTHRILMLLYKRRELVKDYIKFVFFLVFVFSDEIFSGVSNPCIRLA